MKKLTMQKIADELGVSKNSVSLALSGKPGVSEELREKVKKTAKVLGYKGTKKQNSQEGRMIGLVVREEVFSDHAFFGSIILNIEQAIKMRNGHLLVHSVDKERQESCILPEFVTQNKVDGLLVLSHLKLEYLQKLLSLNIPTVIIDHHHPELDVDVVLTDNRKGAYRGVKHILSSGIKNIGFIGPIDRSPSYQERYEGYVHALIEEEIRVKPEWVAGHVEENSEELTHYLSGLKELPECWFCANDEYGLLVSRILNNLGFNVPDQYSVLGFDNSYYAELASPPLTTMGVNTSYFAQRSVSRLYKRIKETDKSPFEKILLDTELVYRESLKPTREVSC